MYYGSLPLTISRQKFLTSANIIINQLFLEGYFLHNIGHSICTTAHPFLLCRSTFFQLKQKWGYPIGASKKLKQKWIFTTDTKNSVPEIPDLLRYLHMLECFGRKTLEIPS